MKATFTIEDHEDRVRVQLALDPPLEEQVEPTQASYVVNELVKRLSELTVQATLGPSRN